MGKHYKTIRLILGDQLNAGHSWFKSIDEDCLYVIAEMLQETEYVKHHVQKVCAFFHAMEGFAEALNQAGHHCLYLTLDDTTKYSSFNDLLKELINKYSVS